MKPLIAKYLEIARSQIGVQEIGRSNRGKQVDAYLRMVGAGLGNPWCAGLTFWCKQEAADALKVDNPFIKSAYTPDIGNFARERSILIPCHGPNGFNKPQPGDDFLVMGPSRFHHTGIVESAESDSWTSIEGNSNSDGSRDGFKVAHNDGKPYASRFYWVRWSALCGETAKPPTRSIYLGGKKQLDLPVAENITLAPVRKWATWMHLALVWDSKSDTPIVINGKPLDAEISFIDGAAYVPLRVLTNLDATLAVKFDAEKQAVYVTRK